MACERNGRTLFSCEKVGSRRICRLKGMQFLARELRFRGRCEKYHAEHAQTCFHCCPLSFLPKYVSTKPTVQHIGHPRNATRAATPAPNDSQGCAIWWTMAQASSAAAAAPRMRCAARKALPNMPTARK